MSSKEIGKLSVGELMEEAPVVADDASISKVIGVMRERGAYEVFTQVGDKVGSISMRDILKAPDITTTKVSSMLVYVPNLALKESIVSAASVMEQYRLRALPIVEHHRIVGQVNAASIIKAMNHDYLAKFKIKSIMTGNPIVMGADDSVMKARRIMVRRRIDHMPIVDGERLEGVVTSSHIVFRMLPSESLKRGAFSMEKQSRLDFPLSRVMDTDLVTFGTEDKVSDVWANMVKRRSTYAVASFWNEVQGIVTYRDFLKILSAEKISREIPVYMVGLPEDPFEAEATRDKFIRVINGLRKTFPEIVEARSIIKTKQIRSDRRRYEVKAVIKTPYDTYSYSEGGYDLPSIYDVVTERMKRLMAQRRSRTRPTTRERA